MRVAIAKPDWGIRGGFEVVIDRIAAQLEELGHDVRWLSPKVSDLGSTPFGVPVDGAMDGEPEFFRYAGMIEAFESLDARRADVLVSTQPPSFATAHPRHLSLFFHHLRTYYDLADVTEKAGLVQVVSHREATSLVRLLDESLLGHVDYFLAGSESVKERLRSFNGFTENVGVFHAGLGIQPREPTRAAPTSQGRPLMISRHEFPKRTELFIHAMKFLPDTTGIAVGAGGRLGYVQELDTRLSAQGADAFLLDSEPMWLCNAPYVPPSPSDADVSNVHFEGFASNEVLERHLHEALCVVAPAYLEDYGLTVIEAMAFGKPVIVCSDGGNLVNLVEHGSTGLVVEPSGSAIAAAIKQLQDDPRSAARMGQAAREAAGQYSWERAFEEFEAGLERVMS
jgi:glycosyltransferase involved in cell wall biosynthesis